MLSLVDANNFILYTIWAAFSTVRMYAVSGGTWLLAAVVVLSMVPATTNAYRAFRLSWYEIVPFPIKYLECQFGFTFSATTNTAFVISTRLCVIAADLLLLLVTWSKTYTMKKDADRNGIKVPLVRMLLRDRTLYFLTFMALNVLNIAGDITNSLFGLLQSLILSLQSIFISYFLLNLRRIAQGSEDASEISSSWPANSQHSTIKFAAFVNNMGEQLTHGSDPPDREVAWSAPDEEDVDVCGRVSPAVRASADVDNVGARLCGHSRLSGNIGIAPPA